MASLNFPKFKNKMSQNKNQNQFDYAVSDEPLANSTISDIFISDIANYTYSDTMTYTVDTFADTNTVSVPVYTKPTDPVEEAELKLSGKCTECRHELPQHEWACSKYEFDLTTVTIGNGGNTGWGIAASPPAEPASFYVGNPGKDQWVCDIFDGKFQVGVESGKQPNWFHRKMQEMVLGFKWREKP
jgi:hypothetical protein